ncbi:GldG family protein [bacterium]|nr:GldG family protein [bacterium]
MSKQNILQRGTQSATFIFLMLGILIFINVLSFRVFKRADLTDKKEYTISDSTKKLLNGLDDIVNITAYFSNDLPPYHENIRTQVSDILAEYEAYSNSNLNIEFVDPRNDEDLKAKLGRMGIPEIPLGEIKRDKQVITMGYMGIAIQFGDNGEVIPFIRNTHNLEYDLTSALLKVKDNTDRVLIWLGSKDMDPQDPDGFKLLNDELNKTYIVRPMDPESLTVIPKKTKLVVVDGSLNIPPRALYAIDQYMMNDGKVIFMTDAVSMSEGQGLAASATDQSIHPLLAHFGITQEKKLVADRRNTQAMFNSGYVRFRMPYPFWPKIGSKGFNAENPAVSQLESLVLPWTSPLLIGSISGNETNYVPLATTSQVSWLVEGPFDLNPQQEWNITEDDLEQSVLVYEVTGSLDSYYRDKPIPEDPASRKNMDEVEEEEIDSSTSDGHFIVIASTRFANNQFLSLNPENLLFMQNCIDSLAIGNDLIGIRSRVVTDRPLSFDTTDEKAIESQKTLHRVMGTIMVPILLVVFGLIRSGMRKRSKNRLKVS